MSPRSGFGWIMRSASLLAVTVLVLVAGALPIQSAFAATLTLTITPVSVVPDGWITYSGTETPPCIPPPGQDGCWIYFLVFSGSYCQGAILVSYIAIEDSSGYYENTYPVGGAGQYSALTFSYNSPSQPSSNCVGFTVAPGYPYHTASIPVGGVVMPANKFAIAAPWLAIIGLVGCIGTVVVVAKKRL